jgi:NitT/TauT family transport system ATP-binding protein
MMGDPQDGEATAASPSRSDDDSYIEVASVNKTYETRRGSVVALDDISFTVRRGEFLAVVGPSGCGKSTLLRIVAGLRGASSGSVTVDGREVTAPLRVGMVFQTPALLRWRTTLDNVLLSPDLAGLSVGRYRERALELLELVGLGSFLDRLPSELSGGMQQRAALCRALVHDPDLLLMDEPFGALDAMTRDEMNLELLRVWKAGGLHKTILFVTHSIPEAVFLADRVLVMTARPGKVEEIVDSVLPRPRTVDMRGTEAFGRQTVEIFSRLHRDSGRGEDLSAAHLS